MDESKYHEILLKEYAEAGLLCRNIEQLTRTSLSLFIPVVTAFVGLVAVEKFEASEKLALSIAAFVYALLLLNTVYRQQAYYGIYVERAKEIEKLIHRDGVVVMSLYRSGEKVSDFTCTFSNKSAIAAALWLVAVYFASAGVFYACSVFRGAL